MLPLPDSLVLLLPGQVQVAQLLGRLLRGAAKASLERRILSKDIFAVIRVRDNISLTDHNECLDL